MEDTQVFKLDELENYVTWEASVTIRLATQNLLGYATGSIPPPPPTPTSEEKYQRWKEQDECALTEIRANMKESQLSWIVFCETSASAWSVLRFFYDVRIT